MQLADAVLDLQHDSDDLHYLWEEVLMLRSQVQQHRSARAIPSTVPSAAAPGPQGLGPGPQGPQEPEPPTGAYNWIGKLHELCGKKLKRNLEKQEIAFSTESVQSEDGTSGYQSTLDCKFFEAGGYLGEVCASKKAAEHSAARVAIEHEFRDFVEGVEPKRSQNPRKKRKKNAKTANGEEVEHSD